MKEELGDRWLRPDLFRFGASALLTDIERQLEHYATGRYAAAHRHADGLIDDTHGARVHDRRRDLRDDGPTAPRRRARSPRSTGSRARAANSGISSAAKWTQPRGRQAFASIESRDGKGACARSRRASAADVDAAVKAARAALPGAGSKLGGHERARHLYALARAVQRNARLFAVLETLDNGKPIRETRDIDIPLVARHFYHHAGWAQLHGERVRRLRMALGVVGQIIPWNFPLLMLAWKIAPALAAGNTSGAQAGGIHAAHRTLLRRARGASGAAAGRAQHRHRRRRRRARRSWTMPDVDKVAFTGSTDVGRVIRRGDRRKRQEALARTRRQSRRSSCSTTPISTAWSRAWWTRSGSTRGRSAARARDCWCRKGSPRRSSTKLRARMEKLRVGSPLDKVGRHGCDRRAGAARAHSHAGRAGRRGRRRDVAAELGGAEGGMLLSADAVHRMSRRAARSRRWRSSVRCWWR